MNPMTILFTLMNRLPGRKCQPSNSLTRHGTGCSKGILLMKKDDLKVFLHFAPVNAMWEGAKAIYKYGHKGVTATKAALYYVKWNGSEKKDLYDNLKAVQELKPYRPLRWKHQVCYFTGTLNGGRVFIKTGGEVNTVEREVFAIIYAGKQSEALKKHIPAVISSTQHFLIEEFVEGKALIEDDRYIDQLYEIYTEMKRCGLLHLDIRPDNFIVKDDGTLILIDFGYALVNTIDVYDRIEKTKAAKSIIKDVGSKYSPKNGTADDAYSMLLTMKYVCPSLLQKYPAIWKELNEDIGERAVSLE